jgi:hypothetical protein
VLIAWALATDASGGVLDRKDDRARSFFWRLHDLNSAKIEEF